MKLIRCIEKKCLQAGNDYKIIQQGDINNNTINKIKVDC